MDVKEKLQDVRDRIAAACRRVRRNPADVSLVVVTKTVGTDVIRELISLGVSQIGENRVQDFAAKLDDLGDCPGVDFHMIGHLQRNKASQAVQIFDMIQSVDSLRLARAISKAAADQVLEIPVLVEVNVAAEESKYGFTPADAREAMPEIAQLPNIRVQGLMTMAPFDADEQTLRSVFGGLRDLAADITQRHSIPLPHLSMGMSQDYEIAVEEGATIVRVGTAIVG